MKPEIVNRLMLFFSSAAADSLEKGENRERLKAIVAKDKEGFMRHAIPMLFTKETRQTCASQLELLIKEAQTLSTEGIVKTLDGLKTRPDRQHILKSTIPISFVSGKLDEAIVLDSLKTQHSAKAVKKVWFTENGHMGHIEDRDFCLKAITEFLA
jgi:pimeloyl-ACP methyl ester carboxylesterase